MTVVVALLLAQTCAAATPVSSSATPRASVGTVQKQLRANAADVEFALTTVESALKQYNALPDAKKRSLEAKVAQVAGMQNVAEVSQAMRAMAASLATKPFVTKENREATRKFLDANQKWCGTVKATRLARQAMAKLGVKGEMSLDDMVNLLSE